MPDQLGPSRSAVVRETSPNAELLSALGRTVDAGQALLVLVES